MSDLRIGQRCRLVNMKAMPNSRFHSCEGDEVVIIGLPGCLPTAPAAYEITRPQHFPFLVVGDRYCVRREYLRPLTDPGADAFMERIKKLGREPINLAEKVTR